MKRIVSMHLATCALAVPQAVTRPCSQLIGGGRGWSGDIDLAALNHRRDARRSHGSIPVARRRPRECRQVFTWLSEEGRNGHAQIPGRARRGVQSQGRAG